MEGLIFVAYTMKTLLLAQICHVKEQILTWTNLAVILCVLIAELVLAVFWSVFLIQRVSLTKAAREKPLLQRTRVALRLILSAFVAQKTPDTKKTLTADKLTLETDCPSGYTQKNLFQNTISLLSKKSGEDISTDSGSQEFFPRKLLSASQEERLSPAVTRSKKATYDRSSALAMLD